MNQHQVPARRQVWLGVFLASLWLTLSGPAAAQQPNQANYDEEKVGTFTLPNPLVNQAGQPVTNARQWRARRAEILRLYEAQVYGRTPSAKTAIASKETARNENALNGTALRREVTVSFPSKPGAPAMQLLIYTPKKAAGPAPVFLGMNFSGNHTVEADPALALPTSWLANTRDGAVVNNRATEAGRGRSTQQWPAEFIVSRGYALVTFYYGDVFPDHAEGVAASIIPHFYRAGQTAQAADDWNALGAWAWALSRAVDYIERDKALDAKRIAVMGHSRLGKATLWAAAQDERFALVISNESGEGGAALARRNFGETLARINTSFPHWFCGNFKQYNANVNALPVDQHMLLSLVAPRPLYIASAAEDLWADPHGEFLSARAADPVYRLLGTDGLGTTAMPGLHQPTLTTIGHHIRAGKHDVTRYDWEQYLNFADKHLRRR